MNENISAFISQYKFPLLLGCAGLLLFGYGLFSLTATQTAAEEDIVFTSGAENETAVKAAVALPDIVVDVEGAVEKPGLYTLPADARLKDALVAAGGMSDESDRQLVAKQLNLASKLTDGAKIYIPLAGEQGVAGAETSGSTNGGLININSATEKDLDTLPGIGAVTAGKIIAGRPYATIDDLVTKKIVSSSVFSQIKEKISVY